MGLSQTTAPTSEPVSLDEAKEHMRVTDDLQDTLIAQQVSAARDYVERITGRQFVNATWTYTLDAFSSEILPPKPPLVSVTSITYVDTGGASQTESSSVYTVITDDETQGRIVEAFNQSWSATRDQPNAITVVYVAGYGATANLVPDVFKQAILLLTAEMYEYRETTVSGSVAILPSLERLLWARRAVPV
tara:strand:+ start:3014 stop:3583 length:570 start_codon:yes stop_codon:yes gene_type:complete